MKVKILLTNEDAKMPKMATNGSAGYDVFLPFDILVLPGRQVIPLDFRVEIEKGYEMEMRPRSGFSCKGMEDYRGERKDADVIQGTIDSDYRGIVGIIVNSHESYPFRLSKGTRIAQVLFHKVEHPEWIPSNILDETERGEGGFQSTGK